MKCVDKFQQAFFPNLVNDAPHLLIQILPHLENELFS